MLVIDVAGGNAGVAIALRFLLRLDAPAAPDNEVGGNATRQIHRHDGVFAQSAALHEQDVEVIGHRQQQA